jgi:hypothetical protein
MGRRYLVIGFLIIILGAIAILGFTIPKDQLGKWIFFTFGVIVVFLFIYSIIPSQPEWKKHANNNEKKTITPKTTDSLTSHQQATLKKHRRHDFKKKKTKITGDVIAWLGDCTSQTDDKSHVARRTAYRNSYLTWCENNGYVPAGTKVQVRRMKSHLRCDENDKDGAIFPGLLVYQPRSANHAENG